MRAADLARVLRMNMNRYINQRYQGCVKHAAEACGVGYSPLWHFITGQTKTAPRLPLLVAFARHFGTTIDALLIEPERVP